MVIGICDKNVIIDDEDYLRIISRKWHNWKDKNGAGPYFGSYVSPGVHVSLHRFIMNCKKNDGKIVDHISGNTLDNRKLNLRFCNSLINSINKGLPKNNTSGYKGVNWDKNSKAWRAKISLDKKRFHLGLFDNLEDAHNAYLDASKRLYGEYARSNL